MGRVVGEHHQRHRAEAGQRRELRPRHRVVDMLLIAGSRGQRIPGLVGEPLLEAGVRSVDQHDADVLDLCAEHGVAYVPFFPLGSAFPGMPKVTDDARVLAVAQRTGASPAQVGLAWLLAHRKNVLLIPGTSSVAHLEENLAVADVVLSDDDLATLAG